jgi:hypothetical protein
MRYKNTYIKIICIKHGKISSDHLWCQWSLDRYFYNAWWWLLVEVETCCIVYIYICQVTTKYSCDWLSPFVFLIVYHSRLSHVNVVEGSMNHRKQIYAVCGKIQSLFMILHVVDIRTTWVWRIILIFPRLLSLPTIGCTLHPVFQVRPKSSALDVSLD